MATVATVSDDALHRVSVGKLDLGAGSIDRQTRNEVTRHLIDLLLE